MTGVTVDGIREARALLDRAQGIFRRPTPLLKAWGVVVLQWVDRSFQVGGQPRWVALKPSTVAARRQGGGSGSAKPLVNTGRYRQSWDMQIDGPTKVTVYSDSEIAVYQEFGTRGPYEIRPKTAKALALPFLPGRDTGGGTAGTGATGRRSLAGMGRGRATGRGSFAVPGVGTRVPYSNVAFRMRVTHPGLPARPVLPTEAQIVPLLIRAGEAFLTQALERRGTR